MKAQFVGKVWRVLFIAIFVFGMVGRPVSNVMAKELVPLETTHGHSSVGAEARLPVIEVNLSVYDRRVSGMDWPLNDWITLTIEDPKTNQSPDLSASKQTEPCPRNDLYGCVDFMMGNLQYAIGQVVTMTDGVITKSFTINTISLKVTDINIFSDKAWGTANPDSEVEVYAGEGMQTVVADSAGNWLVDFASLGVDLSFTTFVWVIQHDEDGDQFWEGKTRTGLFHFTPTFGVVAYDPNSLHIHNIVRGSFWEPGRTISMKIDDPASGPGWDYEDTMAAPDGPLGCYYSQWCFQPDPHVYQIKPGDLVQVSDGTVVKETVVTSLKATRYDIDQDVMEGFSNTNSFNQNKVIQVKAISFNIYGEHIDTDRYAIIDAEGKWMADFGHPGPFPEEQTILDLQKQGFAILMQEDEDGDATELWWSILNPYIEASVRENWVRARNWPVGAEVALTINNEIFLPPVLVQPNPGNPESPEGSLAEFDLYEYDLQAGDIITAASTADTVTYMLAPIEVTNLDLENDTITGTASPNADVDIWANIPGDSIRHTVQTDEAGIWTMSFHGELDLQAGSNGGAAVEDWNGNQTIYEWNLYIPNPNITIFPDDDLIEGNEWQTGATVTIHVGDPASPIYTATAEVAAPDGSHDRSWFSINLTGIVNLQPGQTVTATDGQITKQVKVAPRGITMLDPVSGTLTGVAEQEIINVVLWACADNSCGARWKDVDTDGNWSVRFAVPGESGGGNGIVDLQNRTSEGIRLGDQDGDGTIYRQWLSNRSPLAEAGPDQTVYAAQEIALSATGSYDPEGDVLLYAWDFDNDGQFDDASGSQVSTSFVQPGEHLVGLKVTDADGLSATDTLTIVVLPWTIKGFYQPVDMNGVYNLVKGGSTVPVKFELFSGSTEVTSISAVKSLTYTPTACNTNALTDEIETTVITATGLRYDSSVGQYVYNWKTPANAGLCYRLTLVMLDGSSLVAYFHLK